MEESELISKVLRQHLGAFEVASAEATRLLDKWDSAFLALSSPSGKWNKRSAKLLSQADQQIQRMTREGQIIAMLYGQLSDEEQASFGVDAARLAAENAKLGAGYEESKARLVQHGLEMSGFRDVYADPSFRAVVKQTVPNPLNRLKSKPKPHGFISTMQSANREIKREASDD
ncbi:hypothetical protein [Bifidobacterium crudilactis]|jgi:hypothetical protein|uniref:Uncharacterized protein n=1 Tax=Bifidobacterium crudilactis TaxID=327277 RepID=A0A971CYY5_9BIFI|nr:hypothetical protein [Bifidobacterium crudilactis]MCI1868328.1 hypothetical protein [Bifidobacterium crudilactis]MDN5972134.1 hypothetical protein [Bifidobacterium crudilactis]MDN6000017.1 hypothetical protein [Bifidobacterium crudilactis]MDN6210231.1 hypothetical protein [Bifidobacterium crudilactis]MDN6466605.1 hypothetical protein [Bifidobacterium crudilactis]